MSSPSAVLGGMRELTMSQAVNEALAEELRRDPTVFLIGEDVAEAGHPFKVLSGLVDEFGVDRVIDSPISEAGIAGLGLLAQLGDRGLVADSACEQVDRVALGDPELLLFLLSVVRAVDVADVMSVIAVRRCKKKRRAATRPPALDGTLCCRSNCQHVLSVDLLGRNPKSLSACGDRAGGDFGEVRVLVVEVVLAHVDDRQLPKRSHVHHLVQQPLAERAVAEEAHCDAISAQTLRSERGSGRDSCGSSHDGVRAQVAVGVVCDVHRPALAAAVPLFLAEQLTEHPPHVGAFRNAMAVTAVRGGDHVVDAQRRADADGDGLLTDVQMGETRHLRRQVELVRGGLERADAEHRLEQLQLCFHVDGCRCLAGHERLLPGRF